MADAAGRFWLAGVVGASLAGFVIAAAEAPTAATAPARGLAWLLFIGSAVHVASTGVLFSFREVRDHARRERTRYLVVPALLVLSTAALAAALPQRAMATALLGYFGWQFFHYQKQNLGLAVVAAKSQAIPSPSRAERQALLATGWCGIAALLASPRLLQLTGTPEWGSVGHLARIAAAAGFVAATGYGIVAATRRPPADRQLAPTLVYLMGLLFPLPIFLFRSPYAAVGGMTIAHGLQYLFLVGTVTAGPRTSRASAPRLVVVGAAVLLGGALLSAASHLHTGGPIPRALYGAYLGVVMTHFVVDAGIWRLRDEFPRSFVAARAPMLLGTSRRQASDASRHGVWSPHGETNPSWSRG